MDRNTRWRLVAPEAYSHREWDGESIIYDERNGATHLLGTGATSLLRALQDAPGPLTTEALVEAAFPAKPAFGDHDWQAVEAAILGLQRSGLIETSLLDRR